MMEEIQPLRGRTMAFETRYEVSTQVLSSVPAERLPAMCGSETLAMLVSSTSMNVASVTATAMIQGLTGDRHSAASFMVMAAAPILISTSAKSYGLGANTNRLLEARGSKLGAI